jgi:hypothetical protein
MSTKFATERSWGQFILTEAARFLISFLLLGYINFWYGSLKSTNVTLSTTRRVLESSSIPTIYSLLGKSPPAMPSVLLIGAAATISNKVRGIYGGKNDGAHLGGFTDFDDKGVSKNLWNFMMGPLGVKSFLDVGWSVHLFIYLTDFLMIDLFLF